MSVRLQRSIARAARTLPNQQPIDRLVHYNTLYGLQHLPQSAAFALARQQLDAEVYLPEHEYRALYHRGRISHQDLSDAMHASQLPAISIPAELEPFRLAHWMLVTGIPTETSASLRWKMSERPELFLSPHAEKQDVRGLWHACTSVRAQNSLSASTGVRTPRDLLCRLGEDDPSELVNPWVIRWCASWLDPGIARWVMPDRTGPLFLSWRDYVLGTTAPLPDWLHDVRARLRSLPTDGLAVVQAMLQQLAVPTQDESLYLERTMQALPGWFGMMQRLERNPHERSSQMGTPSLVDMLAIRLVLDAS